MAEQVKIELVVVDKTSGALKKTKNQVVQLNSSLIGTGRLAKLAGTAIAAIGAARIAKAILNTAAQFQDLRTALASVTGSIKQGREAFEFILDFARTSIFEVGDLTTTFIKLRGAGIEPTRKLLTTSRSLSFILLNESFIFPNAFLIASPTSENSKFDIKLRALPITLPVDLKNPTTPSKNALNLSTISRITLITFLIKLII